VAAFVEHAPSSSWRDGVGVGAAVVHAVEWVVDGDDKHVVVVVVGACAAVGAPDVLAVDWGARCRLFQRLSNFVARHLPCGWWCSDHFLWWGFVWLVVVVVVVVVPVDVPVFVPWSYLCCTFHKDNG